MATQELIILLLFLTAAGFIGRKFYRSFNIRNGGGCDKGCGCASDQETSIKKAKAQ